MKRLLYVVVAFLLGIVAATLWFRGQTATEVSEERDTLYDTVPYYYPVPRDSVVLRYETRRLPIAAEKSAASEQKDSVSAEPEARDSADVELPVIQRYYADSTYEAWVSGPIDARLDSMRVFVPTTIISRSEWKPPKRWHIGPAIGGGLTPHGIEPFVGVCVTFSIIDL